MEVFLFEDIHISPLEELIFETLFFHAKIPKRLCHGSISEKYNIVNIT